MKNYQKIIIFLLVSVGIFFLFYKFYYHQNESEEIVRNKPLSVSTSLFFINDFARIVGGDKVDVSLIISPGQEYHYFQPTEQNLIDINNSEIFFYASDLLESWAKNTRNALSVSLVDGLNDKNINPYAWMDFDKAAAMIDKINNIYQNLDADNKDYYQKNTDEYKNKLKLIDEKYRDTLSNCKYQDLFEAGYSSMFYLANRYNLNYRSVLGLTPNSAVNEESLKVIIEKLNNDGPKYTYYPEFIMPYWGEFIRQQSGANMLPLNSASNVLRPNSDLSYLSFMESNLESLSLGLECQKR